MKKIKKAAKQTVEQVAQTNQKFINKLVDIKTALKTSAGSIKDLLDDPFLKVKDLYPIQKKRSRKILKKINKMIASIEKQIED